MLRKITVAALAVGVSAGAAGAATLSTTTSPTSKGELPSAVSVIGGVVLDLVGLNGTRVVSQLSASSLFRGFFGASPGVIGRQNGFTPSVLGALGGGLSELAVRITLADGDSAAGDFDEDATELLVNGVSVGNFSDVVTQETDGTGVPIGMRSFGFGDEELDTGFFYNNRAVVLGDVFSSLGGGSAVFSVRDDSPNDNFFDFTQGVDAGLIDVGTDPGTTSPVPLPAGLPLLLAGLGGLALLRRRAGV
jgi:hypothetical protein